MKTKILNILLLFAVAIGFAACNEDTEPMLSRISDGQLNAPSATDVVLTREQAAAEALTLSWVAPEYNVEVAQSFELEFSLTEDFATPVQATVSSEKEHTFTVEDLNTVINTMTTVTEGMAPVTVYARVQFALNSEESRTVISNIVSFNVTPYPAEAKLYVIGTPNGWDINNGDVFLTSQDGKVFSGVLTLEDNPQFRFYSSLGDWETGSYGAREADGDNIDISAEFKNGVYEGPIVNGKGNWGFANGGVYEITVDIEAMTLRIESTTNNPKIYLVGTPNGWNVGDDSCPLECSTGDEVYVGVFEIADNSGFRFYREVDGNWDNGTSMGARETDGDNINISDQFVDGVFEGPMVMGKGNWEITTGGIYTLTVDVANMTVKFEQGGTLPGGDEDEGEEPVGEDAMYVIGNITDWDMSGTAGKLELTSDAGVYAGVLTLPDSGDGSSYFRVYAALGGANADSYGPASTEADEEIVMTDGFAEVTIVKGNAGKAFKIAAGTYSITVDTNANLMFIEPA
mgnify:CR=1 FL=1